MKFIILVLAISAVCQCAPPVRPKIKSVEELRHQIAEVHHVPVVVVEEVKPVEKVVRIRTEETDEVDEEKVARIQAQNARYEFDSDVVDGINGHSHSRSEKRDGLAVEGSYSYNDGYVKRTVNYVADENGFRIVSEENEPIGDGPVVDLNGHAKVHTSLGAEYEITVDDLVHRKEEKH